MLYSDIWQFHKPGTTLIREAWDTGPYDAYDPPDTEIHSFEQCSQACDQDDSCFQWRWAGADDQKCTLLGSIQHGKERGVETTQKDKDIGVIYKAGWNKNRIREWIDSKECNQIAWVGANINRNR